LFVSALPGEITTSEISLFYSVRHDCLTNVTRKTHFVYVSDTQSFIFQLPAVTLLEVLANYANTGKKTLSWNLLTFFHVLCLISFSQIVQKQTLGEVKAKTFIQ